MSLDDLSVRSHAVGSSTFRALVEHKLSLDGQLSPEHILCVHIGEGIKAARESVGRSQRWLAERISTAQTTVSSWERGRTEPTRADVSRVAEALGLPPAHLEGSVGAREDVPVVGYIGAGDAAHRYSEDQGELDRAPVPPGVIKTPVQAREIRGRSMGALIEGWLVFTTERQSGVPEAFVGEVCEVGLPDDRILVKRIRRSTLPGLYNLISVTEDPMLDEEVVWSARVVGMAPRT